MPAQLRWLTPLALLGLILSLSGAVLAFEQPPPQQGPATTAAAAAVVPASDRPSAAVVPEDLSAIDCARAQEQGLDRQTNLRAGLISIHCGLSQPGSLAPGLGQAGPSVRSAAYGGGDVQVNNALADTYPHVVQSTSYLAAHGSTVIAAFNSSAAAPANYSGIAYSTDGGGSYTEIRPSPFATGHGTNYGDPVAVYSSRTNAFLTFWLATGCGAQGIGSWSSTDGAGWSVAACAHTGSADDRPAAYVDNSPSSPYYGRMYLTWNDFGVSGGALSLATSTDGGVSWSAATVITSTFVRNVAVTGGPDGTVFVTANLENGGGANPRQLYVYRSNTGGSGWTQIAVGEPYIPPGDMTCGYHRAISPIWRQPANAMLAVGPGGVVNLVYGAGAAGDAGEIFLVRSTDNGSTWSTSQRLNMDGGARSQWNPGIAETANGRVLVSWYDRRNTADYGYQRYARVSTDSGATWQPDGPISDIIIPQFVQPDPYVSSCYASDYDVPAASGNVIYTAWADGRTSISSTQQPDVYADKIDFSNPARACTAAPGSPWSLVAQLPIDVYGAAVASDGVFYAYAFGGYSFVSGGATTLVERYSLRENTWSALQVLPDATEEALAVYASGKVYVFGGMDGTGVVSSATRIYDIATNSWSAGADMPGARQQMAGGYYAGRIYIAGGYSTNSVVVGGVGDQTWSYDVAANTWSTGLANMPSALGGPASGIINGHLFVIGGRDPDNLALGTVYDYNIGANSWATRTPMPTPRNVPGGAVYSGRVWVFGGGNPFGPQKGTSPWSVGAPEAGIPQTEVYDPVTNAWSSGPPMVAPVSFVGGAAIGGTLLAVGGYNGNSTRIAETLLQNPLRVLLIYADSTPPATLQQQLMGLPEVGEVDIFGARFATPSLSQLKSYDVVVTWSNYTYADSTALGDRLADFADAGGVVFPFTFAFSDVSGYFPAGRWASGGYSPFATRLATVFSTAALGTLDVPGSSLLVGVNALSAYWREQANPAGGATQIARWSDGNPLLAAKGRAVGLSGYFGDSIPQWSGDAARIIANAGLTLRQPHGACIPYTFLPLLSR